MNKEFTVKKPVQVISGSFNSLTGRTRQFIPIPLKVQDTRALMDAAISTAGDYHGSGVTLREGDGWSRHLILVEDGRYMPPGNWIIQYDYNEADGTNSHQIFLAAELV